MLNPKNWASALLRNRFLLPVVQGAEKKNPKWHAQVYEIRGGLGNKSPLGSLERCATCKNKSFLTRIADFFPWQISYIHWIRIIGFAFSTCALDSRAARAKNSLLPFLVPGADAIGGPCIHPPQEFGGSDGEVGRFAKLAADPSTRTIKLGGGLFRGKNRTVRKRIFICERQRRRGGEMSFWDGAGFPPISLRQLDCPNRPRERGQVHLPFCDDAFSTGDNIYSTQKYNLPTKIFSKKSFGFLCTVYIFSS